MQKGEISWQAERVHGLKEQPLELAHLSLVTAAERPVDRMLSIVIMQAVRECRFRFRLAEVAEQVLTAADYVNCTV